MNTVTITFSTIGYELREPMNTSLLPVEYTVAPLKIATGRARIRRPTAAVLVEMPDPSGRRWQRAFEMLLEAGRARPPETDLVE